MRRSAVRHGLRATTPMWTLDEYMEMITLKTSVLLAASLKLGAIFRRRPLPDVSDVLYQFGKKRWVLPSNSKMII
jgi:geranylgeranyl pyrophosphate synthase